MTRVVTLERFPEERIAVVTLDRPPLNAIDEALALDLLAVVEELEPDHGTWAVLVESACEGVFMVGADLTVIEALEPGDADRVVAVQDVFNRFASLPQPTVCAINGHALGGGLELALACDFRFMARGPGLVGQPEARLGLMPGAGGTQRLTRIVGPARGAMLMMKGLQLSADEALADGLVHELVDGDELQARARDFTVRLARQAPLALRAIKRAIAAAGSPEGFEIEKAGFRELPLSGDAKTGVRSFLSGDKPRFDGT
jgi:enoyl-CoA hydratase/carnithine racemase